MKNRIVRHCDNFQASEVCNNCGSKIEATSYTHHVLRTRLHKRAGIPPCQVCARFELEWQRAHIEWDD